MLKDSKVKVEEQMSKVKSEYIYPLDLSLDLIGGKWKLRIMYQLSSGPKRFGALRRNLDGITEATLTKQLRELEEDGLIERIVYAQVPPKVEYIISSDQAQLSLILRELCKWSKEYAAKKNITIK